MFEEIVDRHTTEDGHQANAKANLEQLVLMVEIHKYWQTFCELQDTSSSLYYLFYYTLPSKSSFTRPPFTIFSLYLQVGRQYRCFNG